MNTDKIEDVMSELLGEGEVTFQDGSTRTFDKGVPMRQIWHEDVD